MKNPILFTVILFASIITACDKNEYLPPDWNYDIPQTALKAQTQIGAFYTNQTTADWKSAQGYTPLLNIVSGENDEIVESVPYQSTADGVLTQQCAWAAKAGVDFFIIGWDASEADRNFIDTYEIYYTDETKVRLAVNYNFSHMKLTSLTDQGTDFDNVIADFKSLYATMFSKDWYYRMPDGRPLIIFSGMVSASYDYSLFIPAFRQAMKEFTEELRLADESVNEKVMDFYIIGENTANWAPPQTNADAARHLDANYVKRWFPEKVYERWTCFHAFTDMAWQNWNKYCNDWDCDFVPCIYPEFYTTQKGARSIERSMENYTDFCNVAKRNIGNQNIILIDSWNDFTYDTALEPTSEYGETYMDITRQQLKL